jgi:hypothetical protein
MLDLKEHELMVCFRKGSRFMKNWKPKLSLPVLLLAAVASLSSCGREAFRPGNVGQLPAPLPPGPGVPYPIPSGYPTPNPTITSVPTDPPITYTFSITGSGGVTPTFTTPSVDTDSVLKIRVRSGIAGPISVPGSNFTANYGCITYNVTVLGRTVQVGPLAVNGGSVACQGASDNQVINFSDRLSPGHNVVTVQVSNPKYDFYYIGCISYPWLYNAYPYGNYSCNLYYPLYNVYKNHTVTGSLDIQVNGTTL